MCVCVCVCRLALILNWMLIAYQQALLHVDVVVEIVQTVSGQNGNDDTGHHGHRTSEKNSLPFCPFDVEKALHVSCNLNDMNNNNYCGLLILPPLQIGQHMCPTLHKIERKC